MNATLDQTPSPTRRFRFAWGHPARLFLAFVTTLSLVGCATVTDRTAVATAALASTATVPGLGHARFWGDEVPPDLGKVLRKRMPSLGLPLHSSRDANGQPVVNFLALSGGGSDGAFGAGLLVGWTKAGDRPQFDFVTGISAGALIAPFAFLGPRYDRKLEEIWTRYGDDDLVIKEPIKVLFGASAAVDTRPLADLIAHYVDHRFLAAVAAEYRKGRILLIGTTNIDAKRPVVWNMGEIAVSKNPHALQLFRDVLLASASIPGAMPPVKITVDADGQTYDELHVDGGVTRQVFLTPVALKLTEFDQFYPSPPHRRVYVIRNGRLAPRYKVAQETAASLAATSLSALFNSHASGDLYRIYTTSIRDGAEFRLAADRSALEQTSSNIFDQAYMKALFAVGRDEAAHGYTWLRDVPEVGRTAQR